MPDSLRIRRLLANSQENNEQNLNNIITSEDYNVLNNPQDNQENVIELVPLNTPDLGNNQNNKTTQQLNNNKIAINGLFRTDKNKNTRLHFYAKNNNLDAVERLTNDITSAQLTHFCFLKNNNDDNFIHLINKHYLSKSTYDIDDQQSEINIRIENLFTTILNKINTNNLKDVLFINNKHHSPILFIMAGTIGENLGNYLISSLNNNKLTLNDFVEIFCTPFVFKISVERYSSCFIYTKHKYREFYTTYLNNLSSTNNSNIFLSVIKSIPHDKLRSCVTYKNWAYLNFIQIAADSFRGKELDEIIAELPEDLLQDSYKNNKRCKSIGTKFIYNLIRHLTQTSLLLFLENNPDINPIELLVNTKTGLYDKTTMYQAYQKIPEYKLEEYFNKIDLNNIKVNHHALKLCSEYQWYLFYGTKIFDKSINTYNYSSKKIFKSLSFNKQIYLILSPNTTKHKRSLFLDIFNNQILRYRFDGKSISHSEYRQVVSLIKILYLNKFILENFSSNRCLAMNRYPDEIMPLLDVINKVINGTRYDYTDIIVDIRSLIANLSCHHSPTRNNIRQTIPYAQYKKLLSSIILASDDYILNTNYKSICCQINNQANGYSNVQQIAKIRP